MRGFWVRLAQLNAPFLAHALRAVADQVEALEPGPPVAAFPILFFNEEVPEVSAITVKDSSGPLSATVTFVDAKGAATTADDVPQWSSDNEAAASVQASADGLSATVTVGTPGAAVITVTSTDTDGTVVTSQGTITVQPGEATIGDVEFAAPAAAEAPAAE